MINLFISMFVLFSYSQVPDVAAYDMLSACPFYDLPQKEPHEEGFFPRFSMCSGDFVEIYGSVTDKGSNSPESDRNNDRSNGRNNERNMNPLAGKNCLDCADISLNLEGTKGGNGGVTKEIKETKQITDVKELKGENEEEWDSVVTCFFVDTAPVVLGERTTYQNTSFRCAMNISL